MLYGVHAHAVHYTYSIVYRYNLATCMVKISLCSIRYIHRYVPFLIDLYVSGIHHDKPTPYK